MVVAEFLFAILWIERMRKIRFGKKTKRKLLNGRKIFPYIYIRNSISNFKALRFKLLGTGNLVTPDPGPDTTPLIFTRPLSCIRVLTASSSESSESLSTFAPMREYAVDPDPPRVAGREDFRFGDLFPADANRVGFGDFPEGFTAESISTILGRDVVREIRGFNEFGIIPVTAGVIKGLREVGLDTPFSAPILYVGKGPIVCNIRDISFSLSITGIGIEVGEGLHVACV